MRLICILFFVFFVRVVHAEDSSTLDEGLLDAKPMIEADEGSLRRPLIFRYGKFQESFDWEASHHTPTCVGMSVPSTLECFRVREAQRRVGDVELIVFKNNKGELRRQFALVAFDRSNSEWHDIMLDMRVDVHEGSDVVVSTPGYEVTVVRGSTFNQMVFHVIHEKREIFVYGAKHLSIPVSMGDKPFLISLKIQTEPVVYMATPDYLNFPEFEERGRAYALEHVRESLETLHELKVPSKAFPGKLVSDVVSDKLLLTVLAIEQSDPYRMFGEKNERLLKGDTSKEVISGVFVRFMLNGLRSYRYICSKKSACGGFQFTNGGKLGTYDLVRANYPTADLDPNFVRGSLSFINGAKAAALLIDLELANEKLPDSVRELYLADQRFGALYPIAAYNGGASQSIALAKLLMKLKGKGKKHLTLDAIPWDWKPLVQSYKTGKPLKKETAVYLRKYQITSGLIF